MRASVHGHEGVDLLQAGYLSLNRFDLVKEVGVAQEAELDLGIVEDEFVILRGDGRIHGDVNGPCGQNRLVAEVPLRAVVGRDDRNLVTGLHSQGDEAQGEFLGFGHIVCGRKRFPLAVYFGVQGIGTGMLFKGVVREVKKTCGGHKRLGRR